MDWLLTNDRSGTSRGRQEWLKRLAAAGLAEAPRPLDDLGQIARLSADDRVIVAGGDGTVNLVARDCARSGCRLGVLPAGTGNDLARGLDIPLDPDAACETIVRGVARTLDLAAVNDRHFLNVAHVGFGCHPTDGTGRWAHQPAAATGERDAGPGLVVPPRGAAVPASHRAEPDDPPRVLHRLSSAEDWIAVGDDQVRARVRHVATGHRFLQ